MFCFFVDKKNKFKVLACSLEITLHSYVKIYCERRHFNKMFKKQGLFRRDSVVDRHIFDADPGPKFHVDPDPYPYSDPDWYQNNADPTPSFNINIFLLLVTALPVYKVLSFSSVSMMS
jgi:hypothetical protein